MTELDVARGKKLDGIGSRHGCFRNPAETDKPYRERIRQARAQICQDLVRRATDDLLRIAGINPKTHDSPPIRAAAIQLAIELLRYTANSDPARSFSAGIIILETYVAGAKAA